MFNIKRNYLIYLIALILIIICCGYFFTQDPEKPIDSIYNLGLQDGIVIFVNNLFLISICLIFSIFAIPIFFSISLWFGIGMSAKFSGLNPFTYFMGFSLHGIGEIICSIIIVIITIKQYILIYDFIRNNKDKQAIKDFYLKYCVRQYICIIIILFICAPIEVYISNSLMINLIN